MACRDGEDSNPLNNSFINFLLQYRTLRVPMEVVLQSLLQAILTVRGGEGGRSGSGSEG